jgi:hypothetical protein
VILQVQCQNEVVVFTVDVTVIPGTGKSVTAVQMGREFSLLSLALLVLCTASLFLEVKQLVRNPTSQFYSIHQKQ